MNFGRLVLAIILPELQCHERIRKSNLFNCLYHIECRGNRDVIVSLQMAKGRPPVIFCAVCMGLLDQLEYCDAFTGGLSWLCRPYIFRVLPTIYSRLV